VEHRIPRRPRPTNRLAVHSIALVCLCGLLVAWARIYLGLHFPIDMAASLLVGLAGGGVARAALPASERWLHPVAHHTYEAALRSLRLPPALFPRSPER